MRAGRGDRRARRQARRVERRARRGTPVELSPDGSAVGGDASRGLFSGVGDWFQGVLGQGQGMINQALGGIKPPTVETELKLSKQMMLVIGGVVLLVFWKPIKKMFI